tara:strand:- start:2310 stop:2720 length:411 start_codon:yes stop_codon:yes gene_type:complete
MEAQINKLATMLGIGGLNGNIALAALAGVFKTENILMISALLIAGPGSIITASLLEGQIRQRMLIALISCFIASTFIIFSAGIGPVLLSKLNIQILQIFGGISIVCIALLVAGIKIPENLPTIFIILGIVGGIALR